MQKRKATVQAWRNRGFRWSWVPGLFALVLVLFASRNDLLQPVEYFVYNQTLQHFAPDSRSGDVVAITLHDVEEQWPREQLAALVRLTRKARAVGLLLPMEQKENGHARLVVDRYLQEISDESKQRGLEPYPALSRLHQELAVEQRLAAGFMDAGNVILATPYQPRQADAQTVLSGQFGPIVPVMFPIIDHLPGTISPYLSQAAFPRWPLQTLRDAATGIGLIGTQSHGIFPAVLEHQGVGYPGMLFQLLRLNADAMAENQVSFLPQGGLRLGSQHYPTDRAYRLYPYARLDNAQLEGIRTYPMAALLDGRYEAEYFEGKTVLVGQQHDNSPLLTITLALDALLQQQVVGFPGWSIWGQYGALLTVVLLLMFLLPRLRFSTASLTVLLIFLLLTNTEFLMLLLNQQWLPLGLPLMVLLLGYILVSLRMLLGRHEQHLTLELAQANRQLGRILQNNGELEQALEKYRRCQIDNELLEQLYHLGLDFERKRQFSKAASVFQQILTHTADFRDVTERIERNRNMEQRIVLANAGPATPNGTVIMSTEGLQAPTLGHYQVERELGRGAMGLVYLARDPRIGREVAIKTMALSSEFEGTQLQEVKERFYREAETAGRLNHPNIVHIYDIGEEQELAYIAMDYLHGEHLGNFTRPKTLLPIKEVLTIMEQVAEALDYAHKKNVVHRDIKPANIIYDKSEGIARVTDFGVACLTDSSKTKTGTVLGSPSYMSPEQVAGKKVDGRSDIFSLGVTLYQMVTGHPPFEADSLGSLMYKITNEAHPKPGKYRNNIPACVTRIINKCMQKDPTKRYSNGSELAATLKRCRGN